MSESRDAFCRSIKDRFPAIAAKADIEYIRQWDDDMDTEYYSYSWFESLANALNREMARGIPPDEHAELLSAISARIESGDEDIYVCIDVAFVENLFWQVPPNQAAGYWAMLPGNLKGLYIGFHRRSPI